MIYPDNFEKKIGFDDIRTWLKGHCISSLGTEWVDEKICFSTVFDDVVRQLQEATEMHRLLEDDERMPELNIFDVRQALLRIKPERTYMEELELFDLKRSLQTVVDILKRLAPTKNDDEGGEEDGDESETAPYPALAAMVQDVQAFPQIVRSIDAVLNKFGKVKDTASPTLLDIRHSLEQTTRSISHSLRTIIASAQQDGFIDRDVAPTMRDGRLVIPVVPALKRKIRGIVHDESATGKTVFIEPTVVVEANNHIRELRAAEKREIIRILQDLSNSIRPHVADIILSQHLLGHIDALRAIAAFTDAFNATVPNVVQRPTIDFVEAVHPILKQSLERHDKSIVPLNVTLPHGKRILLVSGPNAGGKSVTLKTVGLLQYMLQCGVPVPVRENSHMGIFSSIFLDIGDEQSLENDLSTYSSHLINMKQMMRSANSRSLLLIDEFGGGTEPQIGGALAEAMLTKFVACGCMGIITTHYQNLKRFAQDATTIVNGAMLYDRSKMQPLFILQVGNPGSSFAIEIARKIGLPEDVIEQASQIVGKDYVLSDKYLLDIVRDKTYWENKRKAIHRRERELEDTVARYEREMAEFQSERKTVLRQAREEAEQILRASNAKIENTIRTIKEAQAEKDRTQEARRELDAFKAEVLDASEGDDKIARKIEQIRRRQERKKQGRNKPAPTSAAAPSSSASSSPSTPAAQTSDTLAAGSFVRIKGQNSVGRIVSISGRQARVLFGVMNTTVALARLTPAAAPEENHADAVATFVSKQTRDAVYDKKLHFRPEIDLRGMRADEALSAVSHFIDDAILLEQATVRILHGTGTGALRELVRNYLRTVTGVRRFHDEHVQFGGAGITVVEFE